MSTQALAVSRQGVPGTMTGTRGAGGAAGSGAAAWAIMSAGTVAAGRPSGEATETVAGMTAASGARTAAGAAAAVLNSPTKPTTIASRSTRTARMSTLHIRRPASSAVPLPPEHPVPGPVDQA